MMLRRPDREPLMLLEKESDDDFSETLEASRTVWVYQPLDLRCRYSSVDSDVRRHGRCGAADVDPSTDLVSTHGSGSG